MANSKNQENGYWYKTIQHLNDRMLANVDSAYIAKVVKYDSEKHLADVQPLANLSDGQQSSQLLDVPVAENCYMLDELLERFKPDFEAVDANSKIPAHDGAPAHQNSHFIEHYPKKKFMRVGVPVVGVVLDHDNDNWEGGRSTNNYDPETLRQHDINDSIIVAVLGGDAVDG